MKSNEHPTSNIFKNLRYDLPAGLVVFLVALPLCLGIALASGAPMFSGIIAGIVGGLIIGSAGGSNVAVSGPAAGLTIIVLNAIEDLGSFQSFILAVFIAGLIQLLMGFLKAGVIGNFFPSSVIRGMLAAIGLILILKQIPHAIGYDANPEGDESFFQPDGENTFSEILVALQNLNGGAIAIAAIAIAILVVWERPVLKNRAFFKTVPAPLLAVVSGVALNQLFLAFAPSLALGSDHMVSLPVSDTAGQLLNELTFPDFSQLTNPEIYIVAVTIAIIASLETLLSLDATDKLDPFKRTSSPNRELKAQGLGNAVSGLIGGLPITAVIVRSSANIASGARTKMSTITHGVLLLLSVILIPWLLNYIPLSALAAILILVGYKLAKPAIFREMFTKGLNQFIPFVVTVLAILFTDLLIGITIGMAFGLFFVIKSNFHQAIFVVQDQDRYLIRFNKDVSFLNKSTLKKSLSEIPAGSEVLIDGTKSQFIDHDIAEVLDDFTRTASKKAISVTLKNTSD